MLSKSIETLSNILALVDKRVSEKQLAKRSQTELDAAEEWAVRYNAAGQGIQAKDGKPVPPMPEWLFKF